MSKTTLRVIALLAFFVSLNGNAFAANTTATSASTGTGHLSDITQSGDGHNADVDQSGDSDIAYAGQNGGKGNNITIEQGQCCSSGTLNNALAFQDGSFNTTVIDQQPWVFRLERVEEWVFSPSFS